MKKVIFSFLIILFSTTVSISQTWQASIYNLSTNRLTVRATPSFTVPAGTNNYSAGNVSIRWNTSIGAAVDLINLIPIKGQWTVDQTKTIIGSYAYVNFAFVASSQISVSNTSSEMDLFTVDVTGGLGTGEFELAPAGTSLDWFFEVGGANMTNNTTNFLISSVTGVGLDTSFPVELTSFTATSNGRNVELEWKTATEVNSNKFEVERNNGKEWTKISAIDAGGNCNAPKEYSYVDNIKSAVSGSVSYRLKMVDNDGKFEYSTVAEVKIVPTIFALEQNYPNPFNPETKIQYSLPADAKVTLKVYDIVGREVATIVNEQQTAGYYEQKFGGYNYSSGVYFYRIVAESGGKAAFTSIKKMVMIK